MPITNDYLRYAIHMLTGRRVIGVRELQKFLAARECIDTQGDSDVILFHIYAS